MPKPKSFRTLEAFRAWLEKNHAGKKELMMRLFKVSAKERGIGYREALDESLCFGWIDGVRRALDEDSFTQRFTPRKAKSNWSAVNIKRAKELIAEGRMRPPGLAAFEARDKIAIAPYSFENRDIVLDAEFTRQLRANKAAWEYFQAQPPWYRRTIAFWVMSAKREDTRVRRFATLLTRSLRKTSIPPLTKAK
jgi:uncharacterized protein YdeI (YjbR/CyaY-like superfamily)